MKLYFYVMVSSKKVASEIDIKIILVLEVNYFFLRSNWNLNGMENEKVQVCNHSVLMIGVIIIHAW